MEKQIIVLGMHRSGTSMLARILSEIGVNMGNDLLGATSSNPMGHYEDVEFFEINNSIFEFLKSNWSCPPRIEEIRSLPESFDVTIKNAVGSRGDLWGFKEPKTCFTIHKISNFLDNPYYIICSRSKNEITNSLRLRNNFSTQKSLDLIKEYDASVDAFLSEIDTSRILRLNYASLVAEPRSNIGIISDFLGIPVLERQVREISKTVYQKKSLRFVKMKYLLRKAVTEPWRIPGYIKRKLFR